uniref:C2H2-type domain-containing protein n=1 Tax=Labrus bergylta TaxID=56723 RepID=A0A3Q3ENL7_9LABR
MRRDHSEEQLLNKHQLLSDNSQDAENQDPKGSELKDSESTRKNTKTSEPISNSHQSQTSFKCDTCGEAFEHKSELLTHQSVVHSGQERHTCNNCGKVLSFKSELMIHTRTHTGEKTYSCSICGKRFCHSSHLKEDYIMLTDERPFTCRTFGRAYRFSCDLRKQVRSAHTGRYHTPAAPVGKDSLDDQTGRTQLDSSLPARHIFKSKRGLQSM